MVRGVPLDRSDHFCLPFRSGTVFLSVRTRASSTGTRSAFLSLAQHGALRVGVQNASHAAAPGAASGAGAVVRRARLRHRYHRGELRVEPHLDESFRVRRERIPFPLGAVSGLVAMRVFSGLRALLASCAFIIGMLASGVYPDALPSNGDRLFPDDLQRGHARLRSGSGAYVVRTRNLARSCLPLLHRPELFG